MKLAWKFEWYTGQLKRSVRRNACLPDRQALFSDDPEPSGFDSFFGGQRKNGKLKKITLPQLTLVSGNR